MYLYIHVPAHVHVNSQICIVFRLLQHNAEFKNHNSCHTEGNWNNQLDNLFGTLTKGLKMRITHTQCIYMYMYMYMYTYMYIGKVTASGVLCCFVFFVCLTLLASFLLPSSSLINRYM